MQMPDSSKMAELSTLGLLSDKILLVLEKHPTMKNIPDSERPIFSLAENFMKRAADGLSSVENLKVSRDTALAVGTYEIVVTAWYRTRRNKKNNELRKEMRVLLNIIEEICGKIVETGQIEKARERKMFFEFFNSLSQFTSHEHSILLRRATKSELFPTIKVVA